MQIRVGGISSEDCACFSFRAENQRVSFHCCDAPRASMRDKNHHTRSPRVTIARGTFVSCTNIVRDQSKTWIVVANRADAKIFEGSEAPELIRSIEHPEGRLKPGE